MTDLSDAAHMEMARLANAAGAARKSIKDLGLKDINVANAKAIINTAVGRKKKSEQNLPLIKMNQESIESSDYHIQMAAINAKIAMTQYLMMKQMEVMDVHQSSAQDNSEFQTMMIREMQRMNGMEEADTPYDPAMFQRFKEQWNAHHHPDSGCEQKKKS